MKKEILIREFIKKVWNEKNFDGITNYISPAYTIYKDPSDPWEGKTLNREEFAMRLDYTFDSFPDIRFEILTAITEENSVAITWLMTGTNMVFSHRQGNQSERLAQQHIILMAVKFAGIPRNSTGQQS